MIDIEKEVDQARYSANLQTVLTKLGAKELLRKKYESGYQGYVDVDVLLEDGRVYSYYYPYGSCPGCDEWEYRNLTDEEIEEIMIKEATIFDNIEQYNKYRENIDEDANGRT